MDIYRMVFAQARPQRIKDLPRAVRHRPFVEPGRFPQNVSRSGVVAYVDFPTMVFRGPRCVTVSTRSPVSHAAARTSMRGFPRDSIVTVGHVSLLGHLFFSLLTLYLGVYADENDPR